MPQIPVYRAEVEAGLAEAVRSQTSLAYLAAVEETGAGDPCKPNFRAALASSRGEEAVAALTDDDLFFMRDVLTTVGGNGNADVFLPGEVVANYQSSVDEPLNSPHDKTKNIGHVVSAVLVDD